MEGKDTAAATAPHDDVPVDDADAAVIMDAAAEVDTADPPGVGEGTDDVGGGCCFFLRLSL